MKQISVLNKVLNEIRSRSGGRHLPEKQLSASVLKRRPLKVFRIRQRGWSPLSADFFTDSFNLMFLTFLEQQKNDWEEIFDFDFYK